MALVGVGFEFGFAVIVLTLGGWWLDRRWGTGPWLMLTGMTLGFVGGVYNLWKMGKRYF